MSQNPLRLLLDFDQCAQQDREQSPEFLHRRDRRFALDCQQQGLRPDLGRWLAQRQQLSGTGPDAQVSTRLLQRWRRITAAFAGVGAISGIVGMTGLLFYDSSQRINVTVILAFILLQLLLALATSLRAVAGWQPWSWLLQRLRLPAAPPVHARLTPLFMARAAHTGGTAFAATGLVTLLILVVVQDLAFGWSSTLNMASEHYLALVRTLALPWGWLWPEAVPTRELVEATRFFRVSTAAETGNPAQWGQWWPFVALTWTSWVLMPRLLLLGVSQGLLYWQARRLLAQHPQHLALLQRMQTPGIDTGSSHQEQQQPPPPVPADRPGPMPGSALVVAWAGAADSGLPQALAAQAPSIYRAGGRATLADDEATLTRIGEQLQAGGHHTVIVLTRSWEPPTGELQDFLLTAHAQWPREARVALVPLARHPDQAPDARLLAPWLRFVTRLPDGFAHIALAASATPVQPEE